MTQRKNIHLVQSKYSLKRNQMFCALCMLLVSAVCCCEADSESRGWQRDDVTVSAVWGRTTEAESAYWDKYTTRSLSFCYQSRAFDMYTTNLQEGQEMPLVLLIVIEGSVIRIGLRAWYLFDQWPTCSCIHWSGISWSKI